MFQSWHFLVKISFDNGCRGENLSHNLPWASHQEDLFQCNVTWKASGWAECRLPGWPPHLSQLPLHLGSRPTFLREGSKPDVPSWLISRVLLIPPSWLMPLTITAPGKVTFLCLVGSNAQSGISVRHWPLGISF